MNVADLIKLLKTYPKDLPVIKNQWSEYLLLEESDVEIAEACEEREDGWIHRARPDKPSKKYLLIG
jgi:hypothetical protein